MGVDDPQDFEGRLADERRRLADSTTMHDVDRERIRAWLRRLDGRIALSSMEVYLRRCRLGSEVADQPLVEFDEAAWHDFVFALRHDKDLADSTVKSYEDAILLFLDEMGDVAWPSDVDRTTVDTEGPSADEILIEKDIHDLITTARHERDVAFIEFLADSGARLSLSLSLRVGDISFGEQPTYVPNDSARGLKNAPITEYPLIDSAAAIRSYLRTSHPRPDDPGVALFHKQKPASRNGGERWSDDGGVAPNAMRQQLGRIADRAGVAKPTNPHAFRHAAITRMVREGYSRSQIEHRVHWTLDSDMWETYEHVSSDEHNEDIFRAAGVISDDAGPETVRKECGNCRSALAPHHEYCPQCGNAVSPGAAADVDDTADTILERLETTSNPAELEELTQLLRELREHPAVGRGGHDEDS